MCSCDSSFKSRMWETIHYLNEPHLVLRFQNYFGIHRVSQQNGSSSHGKLHNGDISAIPSKDNEVIKRKSAQTAVVEDDANGVSSESDSDTKDYIVKYKIWYYIFYLGTILGDEIFYASFIPFWFWNIDGAVGRRVVNVWALVMYIGQGIKDIIRWPRPASPPVVRIQKKWVLEYGMPSTHAMVAVAMPFSVLLYTMNRYQYSIPICTGIAIVWCIIVCLSRLYLGMHSVLDVIAGLVLAVLLLFPLIPIVDALDHWILTGKWSPVIVLATTILMVTFSPRGDRWTPTRGDTAVIIGVTSGIAVGAWINYVQGFMQESSLKPPYIIIWPSYQMLGLTLLRTVLGLCCIVATRAFFKWASYMTVCALLQLDRSEMKHRDVSNRRQTCVELSYKFITYFAVGIDTVYLLPNAFRLLGIERPTFYTEI